MKEIMVFFLIKVSRGQGMRSANADKKHARSDVVVEALVPGFIETGRSLFKKGVP